VNRIELTKESSTTTCERRGCSKKVSRLVVKENDPFCTLSCLHKSMGGSPWKEDDEYEDPTNIRSNRRD
jgi:hypothetical protein